MPPTVARQKSAFLFYQGDKLAEIKRELGPGASMGTAMTELSSRWKRLSDADKEPYFQQEAADRERFKRESAEADREAYERAVAKRNNLVVQEGEDYTKRGCRVKIASERAEEEERKRRRQAELEEEMDPEELAERRRIREQKKRETEERRKRKREEEKLVAGRHKKLNKAAAAQANKRLEYLIKQSSVFEKLARGHGHHAEKEDEKKDDEKKRSSAHRRGKAKQAEDELSDESEEDHVFLTKQPKCIKFGTLKPYQLESLNWMIHLAEKGLNGILADEMGLGKTLQSISILAYNYEFLNNQGPHLICVPKSTLSNWMNEITRWCPSLRPIRFHGNKEKREELKQTYFTNAAAAHDGRRPLDRIKNPDTGEMEDDNSANPRQWDVCITTYEVCNTEKKTLEKFAWKYLVIDEAHRLKNEASQFSKTVRMFNTAHRLLLTGTPLQNNLHELWALLNFLLPDIFGNSDQFDEWFNLEIDDDDAKKNMINQLHSILRPFMLRRLKKEVAKGLPPKTETLLMVGMSKMQKKLYKDLLLRDIESLTGKATAKGKTAILNIVMQLRKCCGHPYLFEGVEDRSLDPLGEHLVENCGKLVVVDKLMKRLKERGSRVLIFTQMTRVLDILEDYMHMRGYNYCRIDGNTEYSDRERSIEEFNEEGSEKFCFLLSTRAGGLGINLQTADTCILYDSDWNPQADLQAQDRVHRIGQKKPVNIYRLVTENTVEEKIVERAQQKLKLDAMVVQQGQLKDKDKLSSQEIMAAVRFGADVVFRSEESTITDEDIDAILERGKNRTKELADKLKEAEKGDLLDFRMDGGISAQTFEGVDYSDKELRDQLKLLAADSMGKRERRAPPVEYSNIIPSKKTMVVNNRRIKLPKSLRLPRMEDFQFFNRERLMELGGLEFQTYAALREMGQLPPRDYIARSRTLLPPELAQEKLDLLNEGFADWSRGQYYHFVKAATKFGRTDLASISADMDLPIDLVTAYSEAFWQFGPTELKTVEWDRAVNAIEKGEQKIAKQDKLNKLLKEFVRSFDDPRNEMVFANKGTAHFALEQDRALLASVDKNGYGNWEKVREDIRSDTSLLFNHTTQGMDVDAIAKRCDYRIRQMEKELDAREKKLKAGKSASVLAATRILKATKEVDKFEIEAIKHQLRGEDVPPLNALSEDARLAWNDRVQERLSFIDRLREIEIQVRNCKALAEETRKSILRGAQYVNYSNITLKAGGLVMGSSKSTKKKPGPMPKTETNIPMQEDVEAKINAEVLRVKECGKCEFCLDKPERGGPYKLRRICVDRMEMRKKLLLAEKSIAVPIVSITANGSSKTVVGAKTSSNNNGNKSASAASVTSASTAKSDANGAAVAATTYNKPGPKPKTDKEKAAALSLKLKVKKPSTVKLAKKKSTEKNSNGEAKPRRVTSLGNKRMDVTDEMMPELCRRIGIQGTNKRMDLINQFALDYPDASVRQITLKFADIVTKVLPECVPPVTEKRKGKGTVFYLRPRMYRLLPAADRPDDWEAYTEEDEMLWNAEQESKITAQEATKKRKKEAIDNTSVAGEDDNSNTDNNTIDESISTAASALLLCNNGGKVTQQQNTNNSEPPLKKSRMSTSTSNVTSDAED